jgi:GGDEF domain-containing protein
MNERSLRSIKDHLQKRDAQERIEQHIQRGRSEATVTIGRAARLFNFSENQLRDWESRGLLNPLRSKDTTGQRQYSLAELDKLAIIRELIDAGYAPGEIPTNVDDIWRLIFPFGKQREQSLKGGREDAEHLFIEQRVERAYHEELFWRYYASHVLRMALMLICEDIPDANAGLVLRLEKKVSASVPLPEDLSEAGESLMGWLGQTRSFYTFLTSAPSFEFPSDYRILALQAKEEDAPRDSTLIIVERREAKRLNLSIEVVETIRRLLAPLYEDVKDWQRYFGQGTRDMLDPAIDFNSSTNLSDIILYRLANMVVRLGDKTINGEDRWRFCCILLPKDTMMPLQQRSLVVRAQSKNAPHKLGIATVSPFESIISISLRAFQSGHIIYLHEVSSEDSSIAFRDSEGPIRSAIAVPVGGEDGQPVAVLYVVSDGPNAFSRGDQRKGDQRVLRIMGRIVEELLKTYYVRQHITEKLADLINNPSVVDTSFKEFRSENGFIRDVEALLIDIHTQMSRAEKVPSGDTSLRLDDEHRTGQLPERVVSFIAIDVDNQSSLANKYGDQVMRNLSREIGLRIQRQFSGVFKNTGYQLYRIYADRFYIMLKGMSLEEARERAEQLRQALAGSYQINALRISIEQPTPSGGMLEVSEVTVRLGVTSYMYSKLEENLISNDHVTTVAEVRAKITSAFEEALEKGRNEGGNMVMAWDPEIKGFMRWPLLRDK